MRVWQVCTRAGFWSPDLSRFAGTTCDSVRDLTLELSIPEGLHPMERTLAGAVHEELQPVGRTNLGAVCEGLYPMVRSSLEQRNHVKKEWQR